MENNTNEDGGDMPIDARQSTCCAVMAVKTNHMPVRFLIYVAITALTRLLISDVSHHNPPDIGIIYLCGGILLLAFAILVVRYASYKYPSAKIPDSSSAVKGAVTEEKGEV